ncbi:hypothetical protein [Flavobacterium pedocola]
MMNLKTNISKFLTFFLATFLFLTATSTIKAQDSDETPQKKDFWENVRFGGGFGLSVSNRYSNIMVSPIAIYQVNDYYATGVGLQYSYARDKEYFNSNIYGVSLLQIFNPVPEVQLSAELEQLRVNNTYTTFDPDIKDEFWNTALFLGAGYQTNNVTVGVRFNVLYSEKNYVYSQAWMPFVRVYF